MAVTIMCGQKATGVEPTVMNILTEAIKRDDIRELFDDSAHINEQQFWYSHLRVLARGMGVSLLDYDGQQVDDRHAIVLVENRNVANNMSHLIYDYMPKVHHILEIKQKLMSQQAGKMRY